MMNTETLNTQQKHFFFKVYPQLEQLKRAIKKIKKNNTSNLQLSILGKFTREAFSKNEKPMSIGEKEFEEYWKEFFGPLIEFGIFTNQELGIVFTVGSLTSMFLHEIDGKPLGAMSTGPYGILRGLGSFQLQAETYLKALNNGSYLLIIRGYDDELNIVENILEERLKE